ncbi:MAG TPA: hypothetical protein VGT41_03080 [Candidatus Babeliales bacterium]|nr:hypothetical protein [Candidatus Babeliales bacterium]
MRSILFVMVIGLLFETTIIQGDDVHVRAKGHAKVQLAICLTAQAYKDLVAVADIMSNDFSFSGQFAVTVFPLADVRSKAEIQELFKQGYPLAVCLSGFKLGEIDYAVYDTYSAQALAEKKYSKQGSNVRGWGHTIADCVWPILTGEDGSFSSKIAFCKEMQLRGKKKVQHVYIADYDGSNMQPLVTTGTINVAPRFNRDKNNPMLFYSECTNKNIRLMYVDMHGRRKVSVDKIGVSMIPAFSGDGSQVVYCASHGMGNCQLHHFKNGISKQLTHNKANNVSPVFSDSGNCVYFCSDVNLGIPQIYCYTMADGVSSAITTGSTAAYCPAYSEKKHLVAYCKKVKEIMQVHIYDEVTKKHKQLTADPGHKDECAWSPCGNYLIYCKEKHNTSVIVSLNVRTGVERVITAQNEVCKYPTWSALYAQYPEVT